MLSVTKRTNFTSRGWVALTPWNNPDHTYSIMQINLGNNFISTLEIVSALNSFNITREMYLYNHINRTEKYNPKVYLGAVQSMAKQWNLDNQDSQKVDPKWVTAGDKKSGSLLDIIFSDDFARCFSQQ